MTSSPLVSIIVPVFNAATSIAECLRALLAQTYPKDLLQIIVADNGSTDGTPDVVRGFASVSLIVHPGGGSYAARNAALAIAKGDVFAFTDADCLPDPRWIEAGVHALNQSPRPGLVGGKIIVFPVNPDAPSFIEALDMVTGLPQEEFTGRLAAPFAATANALTTRGVVEQVGQFREDLFSGGDVDFGVRVVAARFAVTFAPDAIVRHPARASWGAAVRRLQRVRHGHHASGHVPSWAHVLFDWRGAVRASARAFRRGDLSALTKFKAVVAAVAMTAVGRWIGFLLRLTGRPFLRRGTVKGY